MKIYGIRNCDTMKKAFAALDARKIEYQFHDYKKDGVPPGKLKEWAKRVGWPKIANTRGPTWRRIPDAEKAGLDEGRALALLQKYPSAIKRPVLEAGSSLVVGFDPGDYAAL